MLKNVTLLWKTIFQLLTEYLQGQKKDLEQVHKRAYTQKEISSVTLFNFSDTTKIGAAIEGESTSLLTFHDHLPPLGQMDHWSDPGEHFVCSYSILTLMSTQCNVKH